MYEYKIVTLSGRDENISGHINSLAKVGWKLKFVVVHEGIDTEYVFERRI